jgi:peptide chain release factor 1
LSQKFPIAASSMRSIIARRDHGKLLNYSFMPRHLETQQRKNFIEQAKQSQFQILWSIRRSILTSSVQSRLFTLIERHEKILDEMKSSGHTNSNIGKELTLLAPVASLNRTLLQLNEEHCSLIELLNEANTTNDNDFEIECKIELERIEKNRNRTEQKIINAVLPKDEDDYESDAIIEIRAGTGGDEASLFAGELLDCYIRTSKELKWNVEEIAKSRTDLGGVREATISISGGANFQQPRGGDDDDDDSLLIGPYGFFKFESGVHRVQRIPINDTKIQTSACSVAVLPLINNNSSNDTGLLPMSELRIETMRASGAGGQHINTRWT